MKTVFRVTAILAATAALILATPDQWESLPAPPFPHGTSAGGGLTTDGTFVYAADFSGDANDDFIDVNQNNARDDGESLGELGIANGSARMARFDPVAGTWASLPSLVPAGWEGDCFSAGNFTGSLFHAGGWLYYYQMRNGPQHCVLYRYPLASAPGGNWEKLWDKDISNAEIDANAGMVGIETPAGPVILHHFGGGSYAVCRVSDIAGGGQHRQITPDWPFSGAHFPRNGGWEYDPISGRLYHLSGNQLLRWTPSSNYPAASFLTSTPVAGNPLASFETLIPSLKNAVGWNPGGGEEHPGASLWGNSITLVNAPSGVSGGPGGEDTGANVLYLVRGETTPDGWPFNESRGQIGNGDFARYFPTTGRSQALSPAPFSVGKGSDSVFLNGSIYLTQGETENSPDDPGNNAPINNDGIRKPGRGFARFQIAATEFTGPPVIPLADFLRDGFAALSSSGLTSGSPGPLVDGDWTAGTATSEINPAVITVTFTAPTSVGAARVGLGANRHEWTLDAADSPADLAAETGSFVRVFGPSEIAGNGPHWREWNATPMVRKIFRFTIKRLDGEAVGEIRELELQRPKTVRTILLGEGEVRVNHFEILPDNLTLLADQVQPLKAELSLSLGPDRYQVADTVEWTSSNPSVATVTGGVVRAVQAGETTLTATYGPHFTATAKIKVAAPAANDDDLAVAWIQRLPVMSYVWGSPHPESVGWPAVGAAITWRAHVRNWWPFLRENVGYRWLLDGAVIATGTANLAAASLTAIDLPSTWTFDRHRLKFEIDPTNSLTEFSELNNAVDTWTDAITVGFWVEQSLFNEFHRFQKDLGIGANGWEDWAQRQVARWNAAFAAATHSIDAPSGVLDRIRLDKVTVVADGALPLAGGIAGNNPDFNDRTTDLVWGFPADLIGNGMYADHTATEDWNAFYYEGSLIHELGHARYLIDVYGFNVFDLPEHPRVLISLNGQPVAGTPYMPRSYPWWDHVFYASGWAESGPFHGLMNSTYTKIDRYSTVALNRIAGHRASEGNFNAPYNIGKFFNDLPAANTVQLIDRKGRPISAATVRVYQASSSPNDWYGKIFDDTSDATFTADANGCVEIGRNPFTSGGPLQHTYGISHAVAILRVDAAGKTGFTFLPAGLFNMEYWRGNTVHGRHQLIVPMIGSTPSIADVLGWPEGEGRRLRIIAGGDTQPESVVVDGMAAEFREGAWWVYTPKSTNASSQVTAVWAGGPTLLETYFPNEPSSVPAVAIQKVAGGLRLGWSSQAGVFYQLEHSPDLIDWLPASGLSTFYGTGGWLEADDLAPGSNGSGFSRLRVLRLTDD